MSEKKTFSGLTLGKYTIQGLIGRGRKTEVYRTFHPDLKRDAALKIFFPSAPKTPELAASFRREAQAVAALKHPNIVQVYDFDIKDDHYYMVMELIEGTSLRDLISADPTGLDRDNTVRIFSQIASAVAYAHDQKTVHGNLKPDNVLLDASQRPVLTDFTLPCMMEHGQVVPDTAGSSIPTYLSPEQISQGTVDAQSDMYALGILLYEIATGDVPFKGDTRARIADQHLKAAPTPPSQILRRAGPAHRTGDPESTQQESARSSFVGARDDRRSGARGEHHPIRNARL